MKSPPLGPFVLALGVAAVCSALTTALVLRGNAPAGDDEPLGPSPAQAPVDAEARTRLRELAQENRELRERLATLERRPVSAARAPAEDFVPADEFEAFRAEVKRWMVERSTAAPREVELKNQVVDALSSIRRKEAIDYARKAQEKRAADLDGRVTALSDWLDLDDLQADEMRTILTERDDTDRELVRLWEAGTDDAVLGELKESRNEAFHSAVERVLTPQQLETFRSKFDRGAKD